MIDQNASAAVEGERGITPVSGPVEGSGRALAKRGIGAAALGLLNQQRKALRVVNTLTTKAVE